MRYPGQEREFKSRAADFLWRHSTGLAFLAPAAVAVVAAAAYPGPMDVSVRALAAGLLFIVLMPLMLPAVFVILAAALLCAATQATWSALRRRAGPPAAAASFVRPVQIVIRTDGTHDGRAVARAVARHLPAELRRAGVTIRASGTPRRPPCSRLHC